MRALNGQSGLELARVPRVPGTRGIFEQYCLTPDDFGNFTTQCCVSPLKFENFLVMGKMQQNLG